MADHRCATCYHWRQITSAPEYGECEVPMPWWHDTLSATAHITHSHEGRECDTWREEEARQ